MEVVKTKEHAWLQRFVGEWTGAGTCEMGPGQPAQTFDVEESVRPIGDVWIQSEGRGKMPDGTPSITLVTLGFDPDRKRFVGTFIGSMMTYLWIYDGELDRSERVLTLNAEGPSMIGDGKMTKYQDIVEVKDEDHRTLSSQILMPDGTWTKFMTAHYRRKR